MEAFNEERIAANVLKQLLKKGDIVEEIKLNEADDKESLILYEKGRPAECFTMILQGTVDVTVGMENFTFTHGAFTFFCEDLLLSNKSTYIPDYTVKVATDVLFLKVTPEIYKQALLSTKLKTWETEDEQAFDATVIKNNPTVNCSTTENSPMLERTSHSSNKL